MKNNVSIIIPMYNASGHIERCLSSISKQTTKDFEVLLIDDCSMDDTIQKAQKYPFRIIKLERRLTPAQVRNYGVKNASGDILIFIDADVVLEPDSIAKITRLISGPDTDAVSAIYTENIPDVDFFSRLQNSILIYRYKKLPVSTDITCSFFCAIKRDAFEAIGGYNEKMSYYEDIELGKRLSKKGYRCKFDPGLKVMHLKRYNYSGLIIDYFRKSAALGLYIKREGFAHKIKNNGWPLSVKIAAISCLCLLLSLGLIKITFIPFLLFLTINLISMTPLLLYLIKAHNPVFGLKSYFVLFEIFLISFVGLAYGILGKGGNG